VKFFINILLFYFLLVGNSFSKILNINNDFRLDVSNNIHFLKIENIDGFSSDLEILEEYGLSLYVVGNRGIIDFFEKFFNGYNLEEEDWIVELVSKVEKKAQKTKSRSSLISFTKKEIKKTMIKYNLTTWTLVLALEKPFQNTGLELEIAESLGELGIYNKLYSLNNSELKKFQTIINKELKKNSTFSPDEYLTYKFKPLKVSKDKFNDIFISGKANISAMIWDELKFSYSAKYYLTLKNDKIFGIFQECIFNCSNFEKKFKKMINPIININGDKEIKKKNIKTNSNSSNIVDQLNSLNELYKSGVLTKEEFEKAKKKILN
jgi:hypothetical protein